MTTSVPYLRAVFSPPKNSIKTAHESSKTISTRYHVQNCSPLFTPDDIVLVDFPLPPLQNYVILQGTISLRLRSRSAKIFQKADKYVIRYNNFVDFHQFWHPSVRFFEKHLFGTRRRHCASGHVVLFDKYHRYTYPHTKLKHLVLLRS